MNTNILLRKGPIIHIICWVAFIVLNFILSNSDDISNELKRMSGALSCYVLLFYINYFLLIPRLLFRSHIVSYIILTLVLIISMFVGLRSEELHTRKMYVENLLINEQAVAIADGIEIPVDRLRNLHDRIESAFEIGNYHPFKRRLNTQHFSGLLLIFSLSLLIRFVDRWQEQERRELELEKERVSSELDYLKKQINPHFLFNALNSIYSLTLPHDDDRASESILKLSAILRYMLYETDHKLVQLTSEVEILQNYIGLQRLRITDKAKINFNIDGDINGYGIEPLLFIPFIENAFKYGIDSANDSHIDINLKIDGSRLAFNIENTIVGVNRRTRHSGIGIKNIERRLEILYPENHIFNIDEQGGKFKVFLSLPLKKI